MSIKMNLCYFTLYFVIPLCLAAKPKHLISIQEDNWRDMMQGEWMVEFYAPWCPACKDLSKAWRGFAEWSKDLGIKVADVDVTANPGLSGRFLVTALPTLYHIKDGVFRLYSGPRDKDDFISFIEEKKWTVIDPVPGWKYPDSFQMTVVAQFFKLSMAVRDLHNYLIEKRGFPAWASYASFAGATLLLGCVLGFIIVILIDCVFPTARQSAAGPTRNVQKQSQSTDKKSAKKQNEKQNKSDQKQESKAKAKAQPIPDKDEVVASGSQSEHDSQSQSEGEGAAEEGIRQRKGGKKENGAVPYSVSSGGDSKSPSKKKK